MVTAMPMDLDLSEEIRRVSAEHDRLMAADSISPPVRKEAGNGLMYREHEEVALDASLMVAAPLSSETEDAAFLFGDHRDDLFCRTMGRVISELRHEWRTEFRNEITRALAEELVERDREIASLKSENAELRGMLGSVLAKFDALRASTDAAQQERIAEKRERQIRDQTIAERSARIADLQRENAASHAESRRQHLEQAFGQRDARLDLIETRLGMLLQFLSVAGVDFPRGGF
jgi:hypothetical protein